jgi:hypothetical protein
MKNRILIILLFLTSFIGYLEWGLTNRMFLYQMELEVIQKLLSDPLSILHPLIVFPLIGQLILFVSISLSSPKVWIIRIGIGGMAILYVLILLAGIFSTNVKMIFSVIPFLGLSVYYFWYSRQISIER